MEEDLNYDSSEEARRAKKYPKEWQRYQDDRRRIRQREKEEDEADRRLEEKEIAEEQKRNQEI